jgi:hypothetical protein
MVPAIDQLEVRMARLEGAYEQINERLANLERRIDYLSHQVSTQFYWLLTLILGSILVPIVRDIAR